jgi:hypothetical protein
MITDLAVHKEQIKTWIKHAYLSARLIQYDEQA